MQKTQSHDITKKKSKTKSHDIQQKKLKNQTLIDFENRANMNQSKVSNQIKFQSFEFKIL